MNRIPDSDDQHRRFLRLFASSEPALRAFVRSLVPTLTDTDDIMQEVAVILWSKFDECPSSEGFRPWAFGVARYKVLAWHRDRGRDRHVFDATTITAIAARAEAETDRLARQRDALARCLESLAPDHRRLIDSAYGAGAVMKDVAHQLGQTPMSLYKKLHRIRLILVECTRRSLGRTST
ncbi:MAG: sigma-70 family RNA polymerase sigma factor [Pirellulales bacterium]